MIFAASAPLFSCAGNAPAKNADGTAETSETAAGAEVGTDLSSVTYSCAGSQDRSENFSYVIEENDGGVFLSAYYIDGEGNAHNGTFEVPSDSMKSLRAIFEKYGYDGLIGQRERIDPDAEDDGTASYYFSASYKDGRAFSVSTAGDGASELRVFFENLAGKN